MGFSRQEYWSGLPFPSSGDLPYPGNEPRRRFNLWATREALVFQYFSVGVGEKTTFFFFFKENHHEGLLCSLCYFSSFRLLPCLDKESTPASQCLLYARNTLDPGRLFTHLIFPKNPGIWIAWSLLHKWNLSRFVCGAWELWIWSWTHSYILVLPHSLWDLSSLTRD